jgi:hypothetical protein
MPCPSHFPWLDHSNYTSQRIQVMEVVEYLKKKDGLRSGERKTVYAPL